MDLEKTMPENEKSTPEIAVDPAQNGPQKALNTGTLRKASNPPEGDLREARGAGFAVLLQRLRRPCSGRLRRWRWPPNLC